MSNILASNSIFEWERTVRWVDTDASGVAHFSIYVQMMEEAEYAFLRSRGLSVVLHDDRGTMGFPRLSADINIQRPLKYGETAKVQLRLADIDGKSLKYDFEILDRDDQVAVTGEFRAACCRFPNGDLPFAILIPDDVIRKLEFGNSDAKL